MSLWDSLVVSFLLEFLPALPPLLPTLSPLLPPHLCHRPDVVQSYHSQVLLESQKDLVELVKLVQQYYRGQDYDNNTKLDEHQYFVHRYLPFSTWGY